MHRLTVNGQTVLLDCGLYQGRRKDAERLNRELPLRADSIEPQARHYNAIPHAHLISPAHFELREDGNIQTYPQMTQISPPCR